jgi:putative endonuclease
MGGHVYIMASRKNGTLYTGVTADLARRVWEHRDKVMPGFTARYDVTRLVWYREFDDIEIAIAEEKRIKRWRRAWKIQMIERMNPEWEDLYASIV